MKKRKGDKRLKSPTLRKAHQFYDGITTYNWNGTSTVPVTHKHRMTIKVEKNERRAAIKAAETLEAYNQLEGI